MNQNIKAICLTIVTVTILFCLKEIVITHTRYMTVATAADALQENNKQWAK